MVTLESLGIDGLSVGERIALVQQIWDSIGEEAEKVPFTEAQRREVDDRWTAHRADPGAAIPWAQVEADALARLRR